MAHRTLFRAAVTPIDTSSGLAPASPQASAFLQVDRVSPLGQIGGITVDGHVTAAIQAGSAPASWAGEQASKPVTSLSFSAAALRPLKLIAQIVVSQELADRSAPSALPIVQRALTSALAAAEPRRCWIPRPQPSRTSSRPVSRMASARSRPAAILRPTSGKCWSG